MTTGEAIDTLAKRWKSISAMVLALVGLIVFVLQVNSYGGDIDSLKVSDTTQNAMIQSNNALLKVMAAKIDGISDNLALILQLYGIDPDKVNRWKLIPAHPVVDSVTGFPTIGSRWLRMSGDRHVGWLYKATEDSSGTLLIESVELWNLSKK